MSVRTTNARRPRYIHFSRPRPLKVRSIFIVIPPSTHHPSHYHEMKRKLLVLKSRVSLNGRKNNETRQDWSSPALDNARTVCQLLSNLGSGGINIPGLQAAGLVAVQIIDIIKVGKLRPEQCFVGKRFAENERQQDRLRRACVTHRRTSGSNREGTRKSESNGHRSSSQG
jgi:hypothetical protein